MFLSSLILFSGVDKQVFGNFAELWFEKYDRVGRALC